MTLHLTDGDVPPPSGSPVLTLHAYVSNLDTNHDDAVLYLRIGIFKDNVEITQNHDKGMTPWPKGNHPKFPRGKTKKNSVGALSILLLWPACL